MNPNFSHRRKKDENNCLFSFKISKGDEKKTSVKATSSIPKNYNLTIKKNTVLKNTVLKNIVDSKQYNPFLELPPLSPLELDALEFLNTTSNSDSTPDPYLCGSIYGSQQSTFAPVCYPTNPYYYS